MNGVGVEEAQRVSLEDAEFLVVRVPAKLHREGVDRLREQIRSRLRTDVPVLVLEGGMELDVVRSGGWVYTYEREHPPAPGRYEVAFEVTRFTIPPTVEIICWNGLEWDYGPLLRDMGLPAPYAYRPAPVPPPVRRSAEALPEIAT